MKPYVIGIAGGSGSGKSTLTNNLAAICEDCISVVCYDYYYNRNDNIPFEDRVKINYDHPAALETPLLIEHLRMLRMGMPVDVPQYDFTVHNRRAETLRIEPKPIIIVEGILTFANDELCSLFDMKVFVDANDDYRFARRIVRDVQYRGRHIEDVVEQYAETVRPMYDKYVEPTKRKADIIVVGGGENKVALELISLKIRDHISEFPSL